MCPILPHSIPHLIFLMLISYTSDYQISFLDLPYSKLRYPFLCCLSLGFFPPINNPYTCTHLMGPCPGIWTINLLGLLHKESRVTALVTCHIVCSELLFYRT